MRYINEEGNRVGRGGCADREWSSLRVGIHDHVHYGTSYVTHKRVSVLKNWNRIMSIKLILHNLF